MYICKGKVCLLRHITNYVSYINILFMKKIFTIYLQVYTYYAITYSAKPH